MYLREKTIRKLRIKNVILAIFGVFNIFSCGYYILGEFIYYRNDPGTAWNAVSMKSSIFWLIVAILLLVHVAISRKRIGNANFYSGYFEGDLDGYITYEDLAGVTGESSEKIRKQLHRFLKYYMRNFELKEKDGEEMVELYSKKILCECKNCGANMEKRIFFTGTCPYCGSSDLFAKVLTNERFYSISNDVQSGIKKPSYYAAKNLTAKKVWFGVLLGIGFFFILLFFMMTCSEISNYFDQEYQKEILLDPDSHLRSYDLIKAEILDSIIANVILICVLVPLAVLRAKKILGIRIAVLCAGFFATCEKPYIKAEKLPGLGIKPKEEKKLNGVRKAIHYGYLKHCTLEMHENQLMAGLAKKIVKDQCPSCSAPIVGAVDEDYVCKYCGNRIMGVVEKR